MGKERKTQPLLGACLLGFPLFIFTFPDRSILNRYFDGGIRGIDYSNMASAYLVQVVNNKLTAEVKVKNLALPVFEWVNNSDYPTLFVL